MDFALKTVVFTLLIVQVLGRTVPVENNNVNGTEDNSTATETTDENPKTCNGSALEENNESDSREDVCPTPQCADRTCRIEIPQGHLCPTCICDGYREKNDFEPHSRRPSEESGFETRNTTEDKEMSIITIECNGTSDSSSTVTDCNSANHEINSADTIPRKAHLVVPNPGEAMGEDLEHDSRNLSFSKESETTDTSVNDIQDVIVSPEKGPRRKRSANSRTAMTNSPTNQQRWTVLQQDEMNQNIQDSGESDELERESIDENDDGYDELKIFKGGSEETEDTESNEITDLYNEESIIWEKEVPGCPTPLCENSSCKIGIPPGHRCPTCICTRSGHDRQP